MNAGPSSSELLLEGAVRLTLGRRRAMLPLSWRTSAMFQPRLILHPTDFSDCSQHAFAITLDLARQYQARVLVLYVAETLGAENVTYGEAMSQLEPNSYRQRLERTFEQLAPIPPA